MAYYKLYDYLIHDDMIDFEEPPLDINYKTSLSVRLHCKYVIDQGELIDKIFYAEFDGTTYSIPVVHESFIYYRDATGLATHRVQTIEWYYDDETIGPDNKVRTKFYTTLGEKRHEIARKRTNQIDKASEMAIFGQVYAGVDQMTAIVTGQTFWATLVANIQLYQDGQIQPIKDQIAAATEPWLDLVAPALGGLTVRQLILNEL